MVRITITNVANRHSDYYARVMVIFSLQVKST